ncbi:SEC-C metal-binding domain-containing protein [Methylobacter svalbardensis]|uniref:SEC-C metal-binding domain-containing protein n=1 Tax=Methylobacter svalbardensis TaxID=3080016 RepID=UPI0030EDE18E
MIFEHDKKSGKITAILNADHSSLLYECTPSVCMNPVCDCNEVFLNFERSGEEHNVGFNIKDRALIERENVSIIDGFANQVFDLLDESDFKVLNSIYWSHKRSGCETADYSQLKVEFPKDEIEREGIMITYNQVLPYADTFNFRLDGKRYAVEDNYCVKNKCHCTEAVLCFYPVVNDDAGEDTLAEVGDLAYSIWVNYQSKTWTLNDKSQTNDIDTTQAQSILESSYTEFYQLLRQHHQQLKLLYSNYLKIIQPEKSQKVGRNEPCPCGSGKKYKKCCGAEGALLA